MADLPQTGASLTDYQAYLKTELGERGFSDESIEQKFMLLTEELGELAKAIRKQSNVKTATDSTTRNVVEECGDVLIMALDVCSKLGIDAEDAIRRKEEMNKQRTWQ